MPTRADETRRMTELATRRNREREAEKIRLQDAALVTLRSEGVRLWAENALLEILGLIDAAAEEEKSRVELSLPRSWHGYYNILWREYQKSIMSSSYIEDLIPGVHALIIADLREKYGYAVDGPRDCIYEYTDDGVPCKDHYKAIVVSW